MDRNRAVMLLFVFSEAFFFIALILAYLYYHAGTAASTVSPHLDFDRTAVYTIFLLSSSLTLEIAGKGTSRLGSLAWLALTIILGAVFLTGQLGEYARLLTADVSVSRDVFGSSFFTLTGFHGLHVAVGLVILGVVFGLKYSRRFGAIEETALASAKIYWHFVDGVWLAVFTVIYVGAIV